MRIMQDVMGLQKLIPCTLISYVATFVLTLVLTRCRILLKRVTVQTVYSTAYLCPFTSTSREWTFLPHYLI